MGAGWWEVHRRQQEGRAVSGLNNVPRDGCGMRLSGVGTGRDEEVVMGEGSDGTVGMIQE